MVRGWFASRAAPPGAEAPVSPISPFPGARDARGAPVLRTRPRERRGVLRALAVGALIVGGLVLLIWGASIEALALAGGVVAWLESRNAPAGRAVATTVVLAAAALALVAAWGRATSLRRAVRLPGGRGTIRVEEVEARLCELLAERRDVVAAEVRVQNRHRRGLRVAARLHVTADARLAETIRAATLLTEELTSGRLGVALAAPPEFDLRYEELDLRAGRAHEWRRGGAGRPGAGGDRGSHAG